MLSRTNCMDRPDVAGADGTRFRKRRGSMGSSSSSSSSSLSSQNMLTRTVVALSATMLLLVVEARPLGFYAWNSDANTAITHNVTTTSDAPPTKRIHHLPGSAMSLLVDAWFDVQEQQHNMTATTAAATANTKTASATPQAAPTIHNHPSLHHHHHNQQQRPSASSSSSTSPSSMATTALLEWHECSSNFPVPRIEILSRHAHDNTITFSIEQSSRQQQACQNYHHHDHDEQPSSTTMNTVSPSLSPPSNNNMRWLATQFQNSRGNWICATQETAACRKRFIYTASCPTTTHPNELSWARVALYLADDDSMPLRRPNSDDDDNDTAVADTCTAIRNSVESSRAQRHRQQQQHHRRPSRGQTCAFHFQLPCQPITASASVTTQSSSSWSSKSSTTMSAI